MFFQKRRYTIRHFYSPEELAHTLTEHDWCGCNGMEIKGIYFLNDSSGGDGAQEYAIFKKNEDNTMSNMTQIESITFGWCNYEKALDYINKLVSGELAGSYGTYEIKIESPEVHGTCYCCA